MKRFIPFLLLASVALACKEDGPTVPSVDPQFAKPDCATDPNHPSCKDEDGPGDGEDAFTVTDLGQKKIASKARDLSSDGLLVVGESEDENGNWVAAVWTDETMALLPLGAGFSESSAYGINDEGTVIAGLLGAPWFGRPVVWSGGGWTAQLLNPVIFDHDNDPATDPIAYSYAEAYDVNNSGMVSGISVSPGISPLTVATVWEPGSQEGIPLPSAFENGHGYVWAISNAGYIVGYSLAEDANCGPWHATLWWHADGEWDFCDLHLIAGLTAHRSLGKAITDVGRNRVMVAVEGNNDPVFEIEWRSSGTCEMVAGSYRETGVEPFDIAQVSGQAETVGADRARGSARPAHWLVYSGLETILADATGIALGINRNGWIVGWTRTKGTEHAMLWKPIQSTN